MMSSKQPSTSKSDEDFEIIMRGFLRLYKSLPPIAPDLIFPANLSKTGEEFITKEASNIGLTAGALSNGVGCHTLWVSKGENSCLQLVGSSKHAMRGYIDKLRGTNFSGGSKRGEYSPKIEGTTGSQLNVSRLPKTPRPPNRGAFHEHRVALAIYSYRDAIMKSLSSNRLVLIKGAPGCGKSTQVPQYLLEDAFIGNNTVRIVATHPQHLTATFIAERIAAERGEDIGSTVGYQVRLKSRISPCDTILTLCTNEILLGSLRSPEYAILKNMTHLIIDDVHERDQYMDFLLTCLRDLLPVFPQLHIILMGIDVCLDELTNFFAPVKFEKIHIVSPSAAVQSYFLDEILQMPSYQYNKYSPQQSNIATEEPDAAPHICKKKSDPNIPYCDRLMENVFKLGCKRSSSKLISLIKGRVISVNHEHSVTKVPIISCFTAANLLDEITEILLLGANTALNARCGPGDSAAGSFSARDFALKTKNEDAVALLTQHQYKSMCKPTDNVDETLSYSVKDHVLNLIWEIHGKNQDSSGALLVFLQDYDEIMDVMEHLLQSPQLNSSEIRIFAVHPEMHGGDQKSVFLPTPKGIRKIILSTNISECGLTYRDVNYVIDSGKNLKNTIGQGCKSKSGEHWISKASVIQRIAHAGRSGHVGQGTCFHLYTRDKYQTLDEFDTPEILTSSLTQLCLYSRILLRPETKISLFFSALPSVPNTEKVTSAIESLQTNNALDDQEGMTDFGSHLLVFPIEPQLTKILLYGVMMKCLDPALTIVATLHHGDPFPRSHAEQNYSKCLDYKRTLGASGTAHHSDHYIFVKLFQEWERATVAKKGKEFCHKLGLRVSMFEKICNTRSLLLAQLRASGFVKNDIRELNKYSKCWAVVKAILTGALFPNVAKINKSLETIRIGTNVVSPHPTNLFQWNDIASVKSDWLIYDEILQNDDENSCSEMKCCTIVSDVCLALFGGGSIAVTQAPIGGSSFRVEERPCGEIKCFRLNDWITFVGNEDTIILITQLRTRISNLFSKILKIPLANRTQVFLILFKYSKIAQGQGLYLFVKSILIQD